MTNPTALIAEDEPLLAQALKSELEALWPQLRVLDIAEDGPAAVEQALVLQPQVLFLDIRMPGLNGLDAAQAIVEDWPGSEPLPLIVFVTAYDQYAVQAFERSALDYVLKPVQRPRLEQTCERLRSALAARGMNSTGESDAGLVEQLRMLLGASAAGQAQPLTVIQASAGNTLHMVPVGEVQALEAADKYVRVLTASREHLIRTSLRELLPRLPTGQFWQIHRGTVVRADAVDSVTRDEAGKLQLALRGRPERYVVSRLYAHLFKGM